MGAEVQKCWVLARYYSDSPGCEIVRAYVDEKRAKEDFDLVATDTYQKYQLFETLIIGRPV